MGGAIFRVGKWVVRVTQVELWIRGQGRIAFIHDLVEAITHRRAKGEKIPKEWGLRPGAKNRDLGCLVVVGGWVPCVTVHDCQNAESSNEHGENLTEFPFELEKAYSNDVGEKRVGIPDRSNVAEPVEIPVRIE
jgi:hypothetical protein